MDDVHRETSHSLMVVAHRAILARVPDDPTTSEASRGQPRQPLAARRRVHGVVVTFRRPGQLAGTLAALAEQTRRPDTLVVVDNDPESNGGPVDLPGDPTWIVTGENTGPAGGLARGIRHVLETAADDDLVLLVDDDDPPPDRSTLEELERLIEAAAPDVAATGLVGARYSARTGRPVRVPDRELSGLVDVDWIGGGQLPLYRVSAIRSVGVPDERLFFGFDDLEFGVRLRRAGWRIVVDGAGWRERRGSAGRLGTLATSAPRGAPPWREYYSTRNQMTIAKAHARWTAPFLVALRSIVRCALLVRSDRHQATSVVRGLVDGALGRRGRLVEPETQPGS